MAVHGIFKVRVATDRKRLFMDKHRRNKNALAYTQKFKSIHIFVFWISDLTGKYIFYNMLFMPQYEVCYST